MALKIDKEFSVLQKTETETDKKFQTTEFYSKELKKAYFTISKMFGTKW